MTSEKGPIRPLSSLERCLEEARYYIAAAEAILNGSHLRGPHHPTVEANILAARHFINLAEIIIDSPTISTQ